MQPKSFPILRAAARDAARFDDAVWTIARALEAGSIRNVVWQEVKFTLARTAEDAWKRVVSEPHFYAEKWKKQPENVRALYYDISIMSLHDVIAASKKVAKSKAAGRAVDVMRAYCSEVLPLSQAVASLKEKVVKGRAPNTGPTKPVNPNKLVQTCPVCFRQIAVVDGKMAHHGYKRPGRGKQTGSCAGIRFGPLEVTSEGLIWLIATTRSALKDAERAYDKRADRQSLTTIKFGPQGQAELVEIRRDSPKWAAHFKSWEIEVRREIGHLKWTLPILERKLEYWWPSS